MKKTTLNFKKIILTINTTLVFAFTAKAQNFQWARSIGGTLQDEGRSVCVDANSNVITLGVFQGTIDVDPGPGIFNLVAAGNLDVFISKLDATGNFTWGKSIGGSAAYVQAHSIKTDATGNIYYVGEVQGIADFDPGAGISNINGVNNDIFIAKLDVSGNFVWAKKVGASNVESARALALDANANIYYTGSFTGTVDFDPGATTFNLSAPGSNKQDIFVSKLDASGNFIWAKNMGGTSDDIGYAIAIDINNNVYTTGSFSATADFDPGVGVTSFTAAASTDMFISKLDANGNYLWAKQFTCAMGKGIAVDNSFNVYTTSGFSGTVDFDPGPGTYTLATGVTGDADIFISKLDQNGNFVWAKKLGGLNTNPDDGLAIALDASNNVYSTGLFSGTGDFDPGAGTYTMTSAGGSNNDVYISKLDAAGNFIWAVQMGGTSSVDQGTSITVDALGYVYTTGIFVGTGDFDPNAGVYTLSGAGSTDCFVQKLGSSITTNINEVKVVQIASVYPNPAISNFTIKTTQPGTYFIINTLNQPVKTINIENENTTIDVSQFASGIYYLVSKNVRVKISVVH